MKEGFFTKEIKDNGKERPGTVQKKKSLQRQIETYVDAHLAEKVTLKTMSAHCGVSVSTVTQLFQRKLNTTFHSYLTQRRMQQAELLIRNNVLLEEVGKMVGYREHSTFYRAFCRYFGVSPREFRNRIRKE